MFPRCWGCDKGLGFWSLKLVAFLFRVFWAFGDVRFEPHSKQDIVHNRPRIYVKLKKVPKLSPVQDGQKIVDPT